LARQKIEIVSKQTELLADFLGAKMIT